MPSYIYDNITGFHLPSSQIEPSQSQQTGLVTQQFGNSHLTQQGLISQSFRPYISNITTQPKDKISPLPQVIYHAIDESSSVNRVSPLQPEITNSISTKNIDHASDKNSLKPVSTLQPSFFNSNTPQIIYHDTSESSVINQATGISLPSPQQFYTYSKQSSLLKSPDQLSSTQSQTIFSKSPILSDKYTTFQPGPPIPAAQIGVQYLIPDSGSQHQISQKSFPYSSSFSTSKPLNAFPNVQYTIPQTGLQNLSSKYDSHTPTFQTSFLTPTQQSNSYSPQLFYTKPASDNYDKLSNALNSAQPSYSYVNGPTLSLQIPAPELGVQYSLPQSPNQQFVRPIPQQIIVLRPSSKNNPCPPGCTPIVTVSNHSSRSKGRKSSADN